MIDHAELMRRTVLACEAIREWAPGCDITPTREPIVGGIRILVMTPDGEFIEPIADVGDLMEAMAVMASVLIAVRDWLDRNEGDDNEHV